jgi:DNA-binding NarL/FixJ family response regulator
MTAKLRILLADDHHMVRAGLRSLIDVQADMEVVGEAADGEAACRLAEELEPDVAVLDVSMPILGGAKAAERITRDRPATKVVALTVHEDRGYLQHLLQAGATGYVLKRAVADDLIHAIRTVARGGTYLDPSLAGKVVEGLAGRPARVGELSDREEEVLKLIARGFTNREIATRLEISAKTVETHKARAKASRWNGRTRPRPMAHSLLTGLQGSLGPVILNRSGHRSQADHNVLDRTRRRRYAVHQRSSLPNPASRGIWFIPGWPRHSCQLAPMSGLTRRISQLLRPRGCRESPPLPNRLAHGCCRHCRI